MLRWTQRLAAIVEAQAAEISSVGVAETFPEGCSGGAQSLLRWTQRLVTSRQPFACWLRWKRARQLGAIAQGAASAISSRALGSIAQTAASTISLRARWVIAHFIASVRRSVGSACGGEG